MCNDFSGLLTQSRQVIWKRGVSSHDRLYSIFKADYPELKKERGYLCFEITPDAGYLYPEKDWTFKIDGEEPGWFTDGHRLDALRAHRQWKKEVYSLINLKEARSPINPLTRIYKPTEKDIDLLKEWASVWASVGASVWASVGASVGAYVGSLFNIWNGDYKFQAAADLWTRGFVPSFNGTTWRLHSGKKAKIVYEWTPE